MNIQFAVIVCTYTEHNKNTRDSNNSLLSRSENVSKFKLDKVKLKYTHAYLKKEACGLAFRKYLVKRSTNLNSAVVTRYKFRKNM